MRNSTGLRRSTCLSLLGFSILLAAGCANAPQPPAMAAPTVLDESLQLMVVTTPDWNATTGELRRFKRDSPETSWMVVGDPVPVVMGQAGMGWGVGFDTLAAPGTTAGPTKLEGDNRTPAGLFTMSAAFGFAPRDSVPVIRLPYVPLKAGIECVNDTASKYYTNVIDKPSTKDADWQSSEKLVEVPEYQMGVVIDYNPTAVKGRGSCIFLHTWAAADAPTIGGIALDAPAAKEVAEWIQPGLHPLIAQMPIKVYGELAGPWKLPLFASK